MSRYALSFLRASWHARCSLSIPRHTWNAPPFWRYMDGIRVRLSLVLFSYNGSGNVLSTALENRLQCKPKTIKHFFSNHDDVFFLGFWEEDTLQHRCPDFLLLAVIITNGRSVIIKFSGSFLVLRAQRSTPCSTGANSSLTLYGGRATKRAG